MRWIVRCLRTSSHLQTGWDGKHGHVNFTKDKMTSHILAQASHVDVIFFLNKPGKTTFEMDITHPRSSSEYRWPIDHSWSNFCPFYRVRDPLSTLFLFCPHLPTRHPLYHTIMYQCHTENKSTPPLLPCVDDDFITAEYKMTRVRGKSVTLELWCTGKRYVNRTGENHGKNTPK
jgi:hypothetical protein